MRSSFLYVLVALLFLPGAYAQSPLDADTQIRAAVKAAPSSLRSTAVVRGCPNDGTVTTLREGAGLPTRPQDGPCSWPPASPGPTS